MKFNPIWLGGDFQSINTTNLHIIINLPGMEVNDDDVGIVVGADVGWIVVTTDVV